MKSILYMLLGVAVSATGGYGYVAYHESLCARALNIYECQAIITMVPIVRQRVVPR